MRNIYILIFAFTYLCGCSGPENVDGNMHITKIARYSIAKNFHIESSGLYPDSLAPIYPNPFNHNVGNIADTIYFTLKDTADVKIIIQNPIGDSVAIFKDTLLPPGGFTGAWEPITADGNRLRSGLYFITIRVAPNDPHRNYINSRLLQIESNE
mgnify:CR=1 FL=1